MSLPDILKVAPMPSVENMKILTEVLDPITITDSVAVFQIPKNGILDAGSFVQLGVKVSASGDFFFPLSTGVHALVQSCVLKIGNKVIASNSAYPHYTTAVRQFDSPEHRAFVDMVKSGTCGDRFASSSLSKGRVAYRDLITNAAQDEQSVPDIIKPTTDDDTTPLFSVPLSTLIPMMKSRQLPLFAIKEHVYLEITFSRQSSAGDIGTICCRKDGSSASAAVSPSKSNIKFIFDSLYYTDEAMDKVMAQSMSSDGLSILYEDQILTDSAVPAISAPTGIVEQKVEREIAVAGRTVRSLLIQDKPSALVHKFLGKYLSRDTIQPSSLNFRINDQRIYDRDIVEAPRKYDELAGVMGRPLMVPSQMYSYDADTDDTSLTQNSAYIGDVEGHTCPNATNTNAGGDTDMRGSSHYEGIDLSLGGFNELGNGMKIGVQPIRILKTYKRTPEDYSAREMRSYASVERLMLLKRGEVVVSA